jgi:protein PhnA
MYMEDETLAWAKSGMEDEDAIKHIDSNGIVINSGDTVVLIKDLDVKGTSMVAKRGTSVRNVRLVHDNPELIEGKVNGQSIYILTQFVKK